MAGLDLTLLIGILIGICTALFGRLSVTLIVLKTLVPAALLALVFLICRFIQPAGDVYLMLAVFMFGATFYFGYFTGLSVTYLCRYIKHRKMV